MQTVLYNKNGGLLPLQLLGAALVLVLPLSDRLAVLPCSHHLHEHFLERRLRNPNTPPVRLTTKNTQPHAALMTPKTYLRQAPLLHDTLTFLLLHRVEDPRDV